MHPVDNICELVHVGFGLPRPAAVTPLSGGLINATYCADGVWIVQCVNPIFGATVNDDIAALTPVLRSHGVEVPLLCRAIDGEWSLDGRRFDLDGRWRVMTRISGESHDHAESIEEIRALTVALARFHAALDGMHYEFRHKRPGVHDFMRHYHALERTVEGDEYRGHRLYAETLSLWNSIKDIARFVDFDSVMVCEDLRIIHGDPKISNFMQASGAVTGIVDLDTMAKSRVAFDVGDAVRSWCNPCAEDVEPAYNPEYAREMLGLYQEESPFLSRAERLSLPSAPAFISLELSMRFLKDALCEDYFGFDPKKGHGEHSLLRAQSMYTLCTQMM